MLRTADKIGYGIYLGGVKDVKDRQFLADNNICAVLNCAIEQNNPIRRNLPRHVAYLCLPMNDSHDQGFLSYLKQAIAFIEHHADPKRKRNVLVNCAIGMSRSASIVIGYLIHAKNMSYEKAYNYVSKKRPIVRPNRSFRHQLRHLCKSPEKIFCIDAENDDVLSFYSVEDGECHIPRKHFKKLLSSPNTLKGGACKKIKGECEDRVKKIVKSSKHSSTKWPRTTRRTKPTARKTTTTTARKTTTTTRKK